MLKQVLLPDIGDYQEVDVIEIPITVGDMVEAEDTIITLETDKATMDIPAPFAGKVTELNCQVGDKVSQDSLILSLEISTADAKGEQVQAAPNATNTNTANNTINTTNNAHDKSPEVLNEAKNDSPVVAPPSASAAAAIYGGEIHASPCVRRIAREFGIDLSQVTATGPKNRITKEDAQNYVKNCLQGNASSAAIAGSGLSVLAMPEIDFASFGEIEIEPLSRIKKISGANLHRNWVQIPHVTHFDEVDITELESFRVQQKATAEKQNAKLTPIVFLIKALVASMKKMPEFNASLTNNAEQLVYKKYFHIGVAVDTPNGLVVPVLKDVEQKGLIELALDLAAASSKAREGKLTAKDMQGGCMTISSLGGIGGTNFTPIVNAPEVAILGVARSQMKPIYIDGNFEPRLMLPIALSYDHRVIDGAQAAKFVATLAQNLADIRKLLL